MTGTKRSAVERSLALVFLLGALVISSLLVAKPAHAKTFSVNITGDTDDGKCEQFSLSTSCSLREAIEAANANPGADTIAFNIWLTGVQTLSPDSPLPPITGPVTIDGYTQRPCSEGYPAPCSKPNMNAKGPINAGLLIELDGSDIGSGVNGLDIAGNASNTVIRGLVINHFAKSCIAWGGGTTGIKIRGNFLGTDENGTSELGGGYGVFFGGDNNLIGGTVPEARNLISGNSASGIFATFGSSSGNKVQGNLIGTTKSGSGDLGNGAYGVAIAGNDNLIGGAGSAANTIAHNGLDGVHVFSGAGTRILSNSIYSNGQLGIDLSGGTEDPPPVVGITLNDPKDKDSGPNGLQNYPWLDEAIDLPNGTTIKGTLNSRPERTYTIQVFWSDVGDPDGFGEGQTFLGQKKVTTNKNGNASFSVTTTLPDADDRISATATGGGGTSEFAHWITQ